MSENDTVQVDFANDIHEGLEITTHELKEDLSRETIGIEDIPKVSVKQAPYHPDKTRHKLANNMVYVLAGIIGSVFLVFLIHFQEFDKGVFIDFSQSLINAILPLLGAVIGYYFRDISKN